MTVAGAKELSASLLKGATEADALVAAVVEKAAYDMVALVQQHASGRPGPKAPTGDYRGSWNASPVFDGEAAFEGVLGRQVSWSVGTDRAQAARLEYGFVGPDARGRVYDQPPYPHMGPAYDEIEPVFEAAMLKVAELAITW